MKKILFGATALLLMAACSGNGSKKSEKGSVYQDTDSLPQVEASSDSGGQSTSESPQEVKAATVDENDAPKIEKEVNRETAQYDGMVDEYLEIATKVESQAKKVKGGQDINYEAVDPLLSRGFNLEVKLKKLKKKLSPEQLEKYKKAQKKWDNSVGWFVS